MTRPVLTQEQEARARELVEALRPRVEQLLRDAASQLAARRDAPFGANEFALRDLLLQAGAELLETSLRKKKRLRRRLGELRGLCRPPPSTRTAPKPSSASSARWPCIGPTTAAAVAAGAASPSTNAPAYPDAA